VKIPPRTFSVLVAIWVWTLGLHAQLLVVANPEIKADSISRSELRSVFTGATFNLKDGTRVKPVLLKEGATHTKFVADELGTSETALLIDWRQRVFSGQATMPKTLGSEAEMVTYVAQTQGAVGYISEATPHDGVKVLAVR